MEKKKLSSITERTTSNNILAINGKMTRAPYVETNVTIGWYRIKLSYATYHSLIVTMSKLDYVELGVCSILAVLRGSSNMVIGVGEISSTANMNFKSQIRYKCESSIMNIWVRNPFSILFLTNNHNENSVSVENPPADALTPS